MFECICNAITFVVGIDLESDVIAKYMVRSIYTAVYSMSTKCGWTIIYGDKRM